MRAGTSTPENYTGWKSVLLLTELQEQQRSAMLSPKAAKFLGIPHTEVNHYETIMQQWWCSRHT